MTLLGTARQALEAAAHHDPKLAALGTRVSEAAYLVSDVAAELASYAQSVEADPARLAAVQDRRAELARLVRALRAGRPGAGEVVAPAEPELSASAASAAGAGVTAGPGPASPPGGAAAGPDAEPAAAGTEARRTVGRPAASPPRTSPA